MTELEQKAREVFHDTEWKNTDTRYGEFYETYSEYFIKGWIKCQAVNDEIIKELEDKDCYKFLNQSIMDKRDTINSMGDGIKELEKENENLRGVLFSSNPNDTIRYFQANQIKGRCKDCGYRGREKEYKTKCCVTGLLTNLDGYCSEFKPKEGA